MKRFLIVLAIASTILPSIACAQAPTDTFTGSPGMGDTSSGGVGSLPSSGSQSSGGSFTTDGKGLGTLGNGSSGTADLSNSQGAQAASQGTTVNNSAGQQLSPNDAGAALNNASQVAPSGSGSFVPLAPIPGLTQGAVGNSAGLVSFLQNLYKYLIGLAVVLAIIEIIWGGLEYSMQDSVAKQTDGRNRIQQALFGLVLVLSPVLVFSVINTSILNLSLNIPPLQTMGSGGGGGTDTGNPNGGSTTQKDSSGCTVTGVSGVYQTAQCPNSDAASSFVSSCKGSTNMENDMCSSTNGTQTCSVTATCSNTVGPYVFIDVSQGGFSFWGIVNGVSGYSKYEPLATTKTNSNNGTQVQQFAAQCTSAGGDTCLDVGATTNDCSYSNQSASQSNTCYQVKLECTKASWLGKISLCSSSPSFTIIN